jgi:hypothetical protein
MSRNTHFPTFELLPPLLLRRVVASGRAGGNWLGSYPTSRGADSDSAPSRGVGWVRNKCTILPEGGAAHHSIAVFITTFFANVGELRQREVRRSDL